MDNREDLICGCLMCDGNCSRGANRQRMQAIGYMVTEPDVPIKDRGMMRKMLYENMDLVDSIIIHKRLKQISNGND